MQQPVQARRPYVTWRVQDPPSRTAVVVELEPSQARSRNQLDPRAGLVQQRRRLDCALAAANHRNAGSAESTEISVFARVRRVRCGKAAGELRNVLEAVDANGDHCTRRANGSPVGELDAEPTVLAAQQLDLRRVDVRDGVLLKPEAIVDEEGQRNWKLLRSSHGGPVAVEAIGSARS